MDIEDDNIEENGVIEESFGESFEELFKQSEVKAVFFQPGQEIETTIIQIADEWVFIDTGSKSEGVIALSEFKDEEGNISIKAGDTVRAYFLSSRNSERLFTTKLSLESTGKEFLEDAFHSGIPIQGVIEKEVKGGYEIRIAGKTRAFCPFSQLGLGRIEDNSSIIGTELTFRVTQYGEKGRNIVLSHRAIVEQEREKKKLELKETLKVGMTVTGTVTSIKKFGAFIEAGGIEGLIPVSELSWGRVDDIEGILSIGQNVDVIISSLDWDKNKYSFSLKEKLPDPWDIIIKKYPEGSVQKGKVAKLEKFGAFVTLEPGIDGLLHISELGKEKRLSHAREVLAAGQEIEVRINGIDKEKRRLSLGLASNEKDEEKEVFENFSNANSKAGGSFGTFGDLLKAKLNKK
jgi:small subunit ribosomal protein S1